MKETDLAPVLVAWLEAQHWEVYQEVQFRRGGAVADIVAVRGSLVWIIELKTSLTLKVMEQAAAWPVQFRSAAINWGKADRRMAYRVAKEFFKIGVLELNPVYSDLSGGVHEVVVAPIMRENHTQAKSLIPKLTDLHKTFAPAGSRSGRNLTPYKQTMIAVKEFIEDHPGCTAREIYDELGKLHYANGASTRANLVRSLRIYEDWAIVDEESRPIKFSARKSG